ncbi:MIB [Mytilus coruscus]|uniref:RING-type E3 ubiquitin transferase n=1 Tax=Mytilus coruscus TaxID=42192 RepID=A0A6J8BG28_MYTCO|nr:MIB [Mytilus coruscus]
MAAATSMVIAPGLRVVRGRDWKWSDQDGGEGHLGTIQEISGMRKTSCPDKCAAVLWDNGYRNTYRIGFENSYDLRIYDNAGVAGNRHQGMKCTEVTCEEEEDDIMGYVWQCISNPEVTLCNNCYHADKGDVTEAFHRIEYPGHKGVKVPKRQMTQRQKLLGIDVGARVIRGANWRWANQDGGPGQQGEVIALVNFSLDTDRDAAEITWGNEHSNVYRLGYEGMVDLKCIKPGTAKYYYPYHLPELKMPEEPFHIPETEEEDIPEADGRLRPGDKVMIGVDPDVFQSIHKEMKLWKDKMMEMIGMTGRVEGVEGMIVAVNFDGERYKLHEMALNKVEVFSAGEFVKIMEDYGKVQKLQNGHGDWNDLTRKSLGKKGHVKSVNVDGDVKVKFGEVSLTFNPECLTKTEGPADFMTSSRSEPRPEPKSEPRQEPKPEPPPDNRNPSTDFKAAVEQDMEDDVLIHLNQEPTLEKKRELVSGQANFHPIYTACKNGSAGVLKALLKYAGSQALEEGDDGTKSTPLQIAVKKKHSDCVELLLSYNVNKDAVNDHRQSAVHLAVQNRDVATLRVLRKHKCDINKKDALGDSPVVDAIVRQQGDSTEMLDVILDWPGIDLNFENKNGFSPIHIAARKGDLGAVKNLLKKDRKLLNKEKSDGYTPLHLASCMYGPSPSCAISTGPGMYGPSPNRAISTGAGMYRPPLSRAISTGPGMYGPSSSRAISPGPGMYGPSSSRGISTGPGMYGPQSSRGISTGPGMYGPSSSLGISTGPGMYGPPSSCAITSGPGMYGPPSSCTISPGTGMYGPPSSHAISTGPGMYGPPSSHAISPGPGMYGPPASRAISTGPGMYRPPASRAISTGPGMYGPSSSCGISTGPGMYGPPSSCAISTGPGMYGPPSSCAISTGPGMYGPPSSRAISPGPGMYPGINIDARTRDKGQSALLIACFYGSRKTADILLSEKYNCQIDIRDSDGNNALHLCLSGPPQVMEITEIQRPNRRENDKQIKQQLDLAELLVNKGVSYTVKNNNGKLPQELPSEEKLKQEFTAIIVLRSSREKHQLCPLCEEEGNEVYAVFVVQPCGCSLCNGCFNPKFKRCPNCGKSIQSSTTLKRK